MCPDAVPELAHQACIPDDHRYENVDYLRCDRRGLKLPLISLGLWQYFGEDRPPANSRAILGRAFDLGITHFDLAYNYDRPCGRAGLRTLR